MMMPTPADEQITDDEDQKELGKRREARECVQFIGIGVLFSVGCLLEASSSTAFAAGCRRISRSSGSRGQRFDLN